MIARLTISTMTVLAAAMTIVGFSTGRFYTSIGLLVIAVFPILSLTGGERLWNRWYLEGLEAPLPETSIFAIQAMAFELLAIAGFYFGMGDGLIAVRGIGMIVQFVTIGKFRRELSSEENKHEISRKSSPSPDTRDPRKS